MRERYGFFECVFDSAVLCCVPGIVSEAMARASPEVCHWMVLLFVAFGWTQVDVCSIGLSRNCISLKQCKLIHYF